MSIYELPEDMSKEVEKLASEHSINIDIAYKYYLMGGYEHADYLCSLRDKGLPDDFIRTISDDIWEEKNKKIYAELLMKQNKDGIYKEVFNECTL